MERGDCPNTFLVITLLPSFSEKLQITYFHNCQYTNIKYIHSCYLLHIFVAAEGKQEEPDAGRRQPKRG